MKCVFLDVKCIRGKGHDECRRCYLVPNLSEDDTENRVLCAVAGYRENQKKFYGSISTQNPAWFETIIKRCEGILGLGSCIDHKRTLDRTMVISEPYNVDMDDIKRLITFCETNNLCFRIDGQSAHFPGRCIRIILTKKVV